MKNIYPKIDSKLHGIHALKKYIDKYKGLELQILSLEEGTSFSFEEEIRTLYDLFPNLKEVTVHPPLSFCALEEQLYQKEENVLKNLETACLLSEELGIQINMLYHINWSLEKYKKLCLLSIKKMLNQIRGYNVYIVLENNYAIESNNPKGNRCVPLELCKLFGEKKLKVCLDLCHTHVSANIRKESIEEYMNTYLTKEDASKYVYQIHFSYVKNKDGYKDPKTHGVIHETRKELIEDIELLYKFGMYNCNFITEIKEEDYDTRKDQIKEIEILEDILEVMKIEK